MDRGMSRNGDVSAHFFIIITIIIYALANTTYFVYQPNFFLQTVSLTCSYRRRLLHRLGSCAS